MKTKNYRFCLVIGSGKVAMVEMLPFLYLLYHTKICLRQNYAVVEEKVSINYYSS